MGNRIFCLSRKLGLGMWYVNDRVAAKPYGDGDREVICTTNRVENEQDWENVQFVSTAVVLITC